MTRFKLALVVTLAAFAGMAATAWGSRPATARDRASMTRAVQQWVHRYGGGNCRLIRQRVSTVDRSWASAWIGGHCGRGSADIYGDLVVFHHNGQDRPGVWRVKGVWGDTGACNRVPTRVLVDLGDAGNETACARDYEEARKHEELVQCRRERPAGDCNIYCHKTRDGGQSCSEDPCEASLACVEKREAEVHAKEHEEAEQSCAALEQGPPVWRVEPGQTMEVYSCGPRAD
jgi:hypothetical protein